jgi:predicted MFS family arabinose efflux permease
VSSRWTRIRRSTSPITPETAAGASGETLSRRTAVLFAAAGGIAVANVYYAQPLLQLIADDFHVSARSAGIVSVMIQAGYALGIIAFVPLGDIVQPRRLIVGMFSAVALMLATAAFAPSITVLAVAAIAIGLCTTCAQILLPFAADFTARDQRGRVIGTIQTGLIAGTLCARVAGGFIGAHFGWRPVFGLAAVLSGCAAASLARALPLRAARPMVRYGALLASIASFVGRYPTLRASMALGALAFGSFAGIWTVLAFHLHDLGYGSDVVGYLGVLGIGSVFAAGRFGVLADRRGTLFTGTVGWIVLLAAYATYLLAGWTIWGVMAASAIFPLGVSLTQISNQTRIFSLDDGARSRINTAYMGTIFGGGALGALGTTLAWHAGGWNAACAFELVLVALMAPVLSWYRRMDRARSDLTAR